MSHTSTRNKSQIIYFSHGGGPLPILGDPTHETMVTFMKDLPTQLRRPEAIVVFSAHWEENTVTIQSGETPGMLYDYYGFPEEAYQITYPCRGNKPLAEKIADLLSQSSIDCRLDPQRPYDHGSYIPLMMMYPEADIPVIQISLHHGLNPVTHLQIGKALRPLLEDNLLFIGSGFSYHNMGGFDFRGRRIEDPLNNDFQNSLIDICCADSEDESTWDRLADWKQLPGADYCHPRSEHLLPLHVCAGIGGAQGNKIFDDYILGKRAVAFLWE